MNLATDQSSRHQPQSAGHDALDRERFREFPRWQQIARDVARRNPKTWLAIDDDSEGWLEELLGNCVQTDPVKGLNTPLVLADLLSKLEQLAA
jgi:hypothetical protein